jgi:hypothetical protein
MDLACSKTELEDLLRTVAFTRNLGLELSEIEEGACSLIVPFHEAFERPGGIGASHPVLGTPFFIRN